MVMTTQARFNTATTGAFRRNPRILRLGFGVGLRLESYILISRFMRAAAMVSRAVRLQRRIIMGQGVMGTTRHMLR